MSSNDSPIGHNTKKRTRDADASMTNSLELDVSATKRALPPNESTPLLNTQFTFDSPPLDSEPLEDDLWQAFEQEEAQNMSSQQQPNASFSISIPSVDLATNLAPSASSDSLESHARQFTSERYDDSTFGTLTLSQPQQTPELLSISSSASQSSRNMHVEVKYEHISASQSTLVDNRSEVTIDVSTSTPIHAVTASSNVPPSCIDVASDTDTWSRLEAMLDSKRENFETKVGVGVVFADVSSNFRPIDSVPNNTDEIAWNDFRAIGYALCMSKSKTGPQFIRLDDTGLHQLDSADRHHISASQRVLPSSGKAELAGKEVPLETRWNLLERLFADASITKYMFNAKDGLKPLLVRNRELRPANLVDPQIGAWVLSPELAQGFSFDALCRYYLEHKPMVGHSSWSLIGPDTILSMQLAARLQALLERDELWNVFLDQEMPIVPILSLMEIDGIRFDNEQLVAHERHLNAMLADLEALALRVCGFHVNLASPKQVADVIFNKLGLRPPRNRARKVTSGRRESTTESILKSMSDLHPLPDIVLRYRRVQKFLSTWVGSLDRRRLHGKLYSNWSQIAASTGRITSSKPNLQNLPRAALVLDSKVCTDRIGSIVLQDIAPSLSSAKNLQRPPSISVRSAFVASPGCVFVSADFSQLEMRLLAHVAQDSSLIDFFNQGKDIHTLVASKWKGIPIESVTNEDRNAAKRLAYGVMYGMGPISLADHLGVGYDVAKQFLTQFLSAYPAVQRFVESTKLLARSRGWVKTLFGRRRLLHYDASIQRDYADLDLEDDGDDETMDAWLDAEPKTSEQSATQNLLQDIKRPDRQAVNSVIQGTAADIIKRAMVRIDEELRHGFTNQDGVHVEGEKSAKLLLQIHDELLYECPEHAAPIVSQIIKRNMENVVAFSVPLTVQVRMGVRWGEMKPLPMQATVPPRVALGFTDASYAIDLNSNNTSFGPTATNSTTEVHGSSNSTGSLTDSRPTTTRPDAASLLDEL